MYEIYETQIQCDEIIDIRGWAEAIMLPKTHECVHDSFNGGVVNIYDGDELLIRVVGDKARNMISVFLYTHRCLKFFEIVDILSVCRQRTGDPKDVQKETKEPTQSCCEA